MTTVTLSPKYQVVIPKTIREALGLRPGQKIRAIRYGNRVELIPVRSVEEARGSLAGMYTSIVREPDRL